MSSAVEAVHWSLRNRPRTLAKLSDAELADRLQDAWARYEQVDRRRRPFFWRKRDAAKLPLAYRLWAGFHGSPGFRLIDGALRVWISEYGPQFEKPILVSQNAIAADQQIEEIEALMAEIKRRMDRRKSST